MPRGARIKDEKFIYHIMCRSISEVKLFRKDEDKDRYLKIIKKYQQKFMFKVYDYCLMGNHVHLIIDSNGADISKIMHSINLSYVLFYNKRYKRHGHLFQERFKSKVIVDNRYLKTLSKYIHQNPMEYKKYKECPEEYPYSALGVYMGLRKDEYEILEEKYVLSFYGKTLDEARKNHINCVRGYEGEEDSKIQREFEVENMELGEYRSGRTILPRIKTKEEIINFITRLTNSKKEDIYLKYNRKATKTRALVIFFMRCFCNHKYIDICEAIGNISLSRISELCSKGVKIINEEERYSSLISEFLNA
ncbi:transposase [Oceanirhabdus sp. W0125-5]|uniref:transposase n=1 Tax=Oceanirhabdus sp. W0125-5 TaxID=2999116 RepID=UPI0022F34323|nr:transposase [Oceanirhabdus sp. W0125-5]WBW97853.1 transposase [Oceanirhabdus sp. W0125-5]